MKALPQDADFDNASLNDPSLYMNRELSLLEFQRRVLEEARDPHNKLLERVKFISIVSSNLDEFFMVRVAALKQKLAAGRNDLSIDGKTVTQQLEAVHASVDQLVIQIYDCFQNQLLPELAQNGITIADYATLDEREREAVDRYYLETVFPVLTPLAFDPGRPFPHISNLSLNLPIRRQQSKQRDINVRIGYSHSSRTTSRHRAIRRRICVVDYGISCMVLK